MAIIGGILAGIGIIIMLIYGIIILIKAFQESVVWGICFMIVPFAAIVFIVKHWEVCKQPFLRYLMGLVVYIIGAFMLFPSLAASAS